MSMVTAWEWIAAGEFWGGLAVGVFGGTLSGSLGVSSGGVLVPVLALALSMDQHRAQAVSLAAQVLPTSLPGVLLYARRGHGTPWAWVALVSLGFLAGAYVGALGAGSLPDDALRWMFVAYLTLLVALVYLRGGPAAASRAPEYSELHAGRAAALLAVGAAGGASSGLLGIGGGLAITATMIGLMRVSQHRAQAVSLAVTMLPLGLPAVWVYARQDPELPWRMVAGVVAGLALGTLVGAKWATGLDERRLRGWFLALILAMAALMTGRALRLW